MQSVYFVFQFRLVRKLLPDNIKYVEVKEKRFNIQEDNVIECDFLTLDEFDQLVSDLDWLQ